jgi:sulfur carrier protein
MQITINGKIEEVIDTTLVGLLKSKHIEPQMVSVELNAVMLNRSDYPQTILKAGDQIEFLYFMGGGAATAANGMSALVGALCNVMGPLVLFGAEA